MERNFARSFFAPPEIRGGWSDNPLILAAMMKGVTSR